VSALFDADRDLPSCPLSTWGGDPCRCRWCDAEIPPRRRRWCSDACHREYEVNHWWVATRWAALRRDGYACVRPECPGESRSQRVEVHHKVPILGRHGEGGCHHHLDGVETLCHPHHLEAHHGPKPPRPEQLALA
jgi:hypothetical protein